MRNERAPDYSVSHLAEAGKVLQQAVRRHDDADDGDQNAPAFHAANNAHQSIAHIFQASEVRAEDFRHVDAFENVEILFLHDSFPPSREAIGDRNIVRKAAQEDSTKGSLKQFCAGRNAQSTAQKNVCSAWCSKSGTSAILRDQA